jgi:hypothetical protein
MIDSFEIIVYINLMLVRVMQFAYSIVAPVELARIMLYAAHAYWTELGDIPVAINTELFNQ